MLPAVFLLGMAVAHYHWFPYPQLKSLKQQFWPVEVTFTNNSQYYLHRKSFFELDTNNDYDVVFVGDSLTDDAEWHALFPQLKVANRGIQGDTTQGVLDRMDSIFSTGAPTVFIMLGTNDVLQSQPVAGIVDRYQKIIAALLDKKLNVYLQSTPLLGKLYSHYNTNINSLNEELKQLANNDDGVVFIDLNAVLMDESLGQLDPELTYDDIHLTGSGYQRWQTAIYPFLSSP